MTKIEIDLDDLGLLYNPEGEPIGRATLQDRVIEAAAHYLIQSDRDMRLEVQQKVAQVIEEQATEKVAELVAEVLAGPIQRTSPWGEARGEPTTVREIIREKVEAFLNGRGRGRDSFGRDPKNLHDFVEDATKNVLGGELAEAVKEAKATIRERVTDAALKAAVEALAR